MRWSLSAAVFLCAAFTCALPVCRAVGAADPDSGRRAATVNGALISGEAFDQELKRVERMNLRGKVAAGPVSRKQVLENLIVRELLYQEALRQGLRVSADEVGAKLAELNGRLSGDAALERALDSMGLSPEALGAQLERGMVVEKYLEENFAKAAAVSGAEVDAYYQEHQDQYREPLRLRLSHILVKSDPAWDAAGKERARLKILALQRRISEGEEFAALAREASDCYSAKSGGDLGYFMAGQLGKTVEEAARGLKVGEVSGVVEDRYGLHLLRLTELRPAAALPLERVRGKILAQLKKEKELAALAPVLRRLRAAAKIEILLNE
jgi:peptidyl-prolyl cis-trans isomerase C